MCQNSLPKLRLQETHASAAFCSSHLSVDGWVPSTSLLLQIMLQYTRGHVHLKELVLSFSWDKYSQVELIAGSYDSSLSVSLSLSF